MPAAEIITIGTEILLGEIVDTNTRHIARQLREQGIDIFRTASIGDNPERIALSIREAAQRAEIIIATGGLGPTIDDPTREAVGLALGVPSEYREELWDQITARFARFGLKPTENNRRQAFLPQGARAIENPVGTAPAFSIEIPAPGSSTPCVLYALPGVPNEMETLLEQAVLPDLRRRFGQASRFLVRVLHTAGIGESRIDERIADLEALANPTVGLAAHSGQVDVRIAAKGANLEEAAALLAPIEAEVRSRLGAWVYGADEETLAGVALRRATDLGYSLVLLEAGLQGHLIEAFSGADPSFLRALALPDSIGSEEVLRQELFRFAPPVAGQIALAASLAPSGEKTEIFLALIAPDREKVYRVPYGGPPALAASRAVNYACDLLNKINSPEPAAR